ncbi:MAG: nucleotide sugar dehydrogenase [Acidobacteriota bacterium]
MNQIARDLLAKIEDTSVRVGVIGLGYVGLPLSLAFAERGVVTLGFDIDPAKIEAIHGGKSYIDGVDSDALAAVVASGHLESTVDFDRLGEMDALLICVPTPLTRHREPDLSFVLNTGREIARSLKRGQLVVLESTTYPGTTDRELREVLDEAGLVCGEEYLLAFSPEREDPGNQKYGTTTIPKVVGGVDVAAGTVAEELYKLVVAETVRVSSARVAEAAKLTENIFRAVNIALVNELKVLYDSMEIDVREVIDAAATKPFGFMRFDPGPGWGGHCIPVDPFYLSWKAREYDQQARFIELAGTINVEMPKYVVGKLQGALNERGKAVHGSRILLLGLAYKKNVADPRESPAFEILELLHELGADLSYHDPLIGETPPMRSWPDMPKMSSVALTPELLSQIDAVCLVTDHDEVDYELVLDAAPLIVDTRAIFPPEHEKVLRA